MSAEETRVLLPKPQRWHNTPTPQVRAFEGHAEWILRGRYITSDGKPGAYVAEVEAANARNGGMPRSADANRRQARSNVRTMRAYERLKTVSGERFDSAKLTPLAYAAFRRGALTEAQARMLGVSENAIRARRKSA